MSIDACLPAGAAHAVARPHRRAQPAQVLLPSEGDGLIVWLERQEEGGAVLHLEGALDLVGGAHLGTTTEQVRATHEGLLTIDATALHFIDLSGYRALLACCSHEPGTDGRPGLLVGASVERLQHLCAIAGCGVHFDVDDHRAGEIASQTSSIG